MASSTSEKRARKGGASRTRSFGGCITCRGRHMKCDEGHPTCLMCRRAGLSCAGYEKSIFFDFEHASEARFRRPLLTENERECMSKWLISSVPPRSALWNISLIDEECVDAPESQDIQISRGPFGAFRLAKQQSDPQCTSISEFQEDFDYSLAILQNNDEDLFPSAEGWALTPRTQQMLETMLDVANESHSSPTMGFDSLLNESGIVQEIFDDVNMSAAEKAPTALINAPKSQSFHISDGIREAPCRISISPTLDSNVPHDAVFLLKHYSTTILRSLTPFKHSKTPWHILFIPQVKSSLAALTLGERMDHANLCLFYGTLAISALSLVGVSQSQMWLEQGKLYKQHAREQLRLMLKTAYDVPKTAKYKSILMALLTMVHISIVSGSQDRTEHYMLETEKFIRVKGLGRTKSRKIRLLHHCYAYERFFHESTFLCSAKSLRRQHVRKAIESSGAVAYSRDELSFCLSPWDNLEKEMLRVKGVEESENDLHLQLPGVWNNTLYPEIFGLPEPYLLLLSLVIRLAREKECAETNAADALSLKDFASRAKSLEKCIKQVKQLSADACLKMQQQQQISQHVLDNMLDAMQHGLAIYFYRRIYDLDASLLQQKVIGIRDCLLRFESADAGEGNGSVRMVWPAFIAACEADDAEVKDCFSSWFQKSAKRSGLRLFNDTLANVKRLWEEKGCADGRNVTWMSLMSTTSNSHSIKQKI